MVEMPSSPLFDPAAFSNWILDRVSSAAASASHPDNQPIPRQVLEGICLEVIKISSEVACDTIRFKQ